MSDNLETNSSTFWIEFEKWYFEPKEFERNGNLYKRLGVELYRKQYLKIGIEKKPFKDILKGVSEKALEDSIHITIGHEKTHLMWNLLATSLMAYTLTHGQYEITAAVGC